MVVHPGSGKGQAPAPTFKKLGKAMKAALEGRPSARPLLFENTAGAGFTIGRTFEELARVIDVSGGGERLGVCLDSCHLLASGYEVRDARGVQARSSTSTTRVVGLDRLRALHLNDSKTALGSNVDRHATLGDGEIGEDGLRVFLSENALQRPAGAARDGPGRDTGPDKGQIDIAKRCVTRRVRTQRSRRSNAR